MASGGCRHQTPAYHWISVTVFILLRPDSFEKFEKLSWNTKEANILFAQVVWLLGAATPRPLHIIEFQWQSWFCFEPRPDSFEKFEILSWNTKEAIILFAQVVWYLGAATPGPQTPVYQFNSRNSLDLSMARFVEKYEKLSWNIKEAIILFAKVVWLQGLPPPDPYNPTYHWISVILLNVYWIPNLSVFSCAYFVFYFLSEKYSGPNFLYLTLVSNPRPRPRLNWWFPGPGPGQISQVFPGPGLNRHPRPRPRLRSRPRSTTV